MSIRAFYNEIDPFACAWLSGLMDAGLITPGSICDKSIADVTPDDVAGFDRCHFFAGIAGWDLALNLAEWGGRLAWTGSCPCQPFSAAGKGQGFSDPRHLWPAWFRLIRECRPSVVFGEQVASPAGLAWFDTVSTNVEGEDYAIGAADLCAAGVGPPHIRQRLFFVAEYRQLLQPSRRGAGSREADRRGAPSQLAGSSAPSRMADAEEYGRGQGRADDARSREGVGPQRAGLRPAHASGSVRLAHDQPERLEGQHEARPATGPVERGDGDPSGMADPERERVPSSGARREKYKQKHGERERLRPDAGAGANSSWTDIRWLPCRDGKLRPVPVEPSLFPLVANGSIRNRVGLLRGAGNAIVPQAAAEFIAAYRESVTAEEEEVSP